MLAPGRDSTPSAAELYGKFRESGILAGSPLGEEEAFHELVGLCLARDLFLYPANSPELIEFACSREGAKAVMGGESGEDAERYRIIHATWRELEDELATSTGWRPSATSISPWRSRKSSIPTSWPWSSMSATIRGSPGRSWRSWKRNS
jgi:hypothetical protein